MVAEIGRDSVPKALIAARDALAAMKTPRRKTEAERKLDEILRDLSTRKNQAAQEAARRKLERIRVKLEALKLAAGSAAATGDARRARRVAKEIRDAARELGHALAVVKGGNTGLIASTGAAAAMKAEPAASSEAEVKSAAAQKPPQQSDLAMLKGEALGVLKALKKVMRKLRETGLHPGIAAKDRAEMEKTFREAERELTGSLAAAIPTAGEAVDLAV